MKYLTREEKLYALDTCKTTLLHAKRIQYPKSMINSDKKCVFFSLNSQTCVKDIIEYLYVNNLIRPFPLYDYFTYY